MTSRHAHKFITGAIDQPGTSSAADDFGLDMSVDEIDGSKDEKNEVFVDDDSDVE